jgi:hypothetical protein
MKKTLFIFLALIVIGIGTHNALASFVIDYGNGMKFNFENAVTVNNHTYQIDNIEYNSDQLSNGQYYLNTIDAIYAPNATMAYYDDDIDATGEIKSKFKLSSAAAYNSNELTVTDYISPQAEGASNKIAFIKSRTIPIDPGEYIIDTFVNNGLVTSLKVCLPTFTSITGKTVGSVTCANSSTQNNNNNTGTTQTQSSIDPVLNQVLSAPAGSPVEVIMTESVINNTTASFKFSAKAKQPGPVILMMAYATSAAGISFDNSNTTATRVVIHSDNTPVVNQVVSVNAPPLLTGLQPNTKYFFQIKDTVNNKLYQQVSFTTSGTAPAPQQAPNVATTSGITITVNNTVTTPMTADPNGKYTAKITGTVKTNSLMRLGLSLYLADDISSYTGPVTIFQEQSVAANDEKPFEYILNDLKAGTRYRFVIRESTQNIELTGSFTFVTQGQQPVAVVTPYDPNAGPGVVLDYTFPTSLGEPTGNVPAPRTDAPTLVPCGKISDINTKDENCQFRHIAILIGNVIQFLLVMLIPLTVLACVYTGVQMILHRSIPADLIKYKDRLLKIGGGLVLMLLAFTIVATIMKAFLGDDASRYLLIDISNL